MKAKQKNRKPTNPIHAARIQAILQIRLDGAESYDVVSYVSEQENADNAPWKMGKARKHLCDRTIRRYIQQADALIVANCRTADPDAFYRHLAKVRSLYARAVNTGDLSNARGLLRDAAELQDFYPAKRVKAEHRGHIQFDDYADFTPEELEAERRRLERLLADERPASIGNASTF